MKKLSLQPTTDFVMVKPDAPLGKTRSGLFVPDVAKKKTLRGTVMAVGPGKEVDGNLQPMSVTAGQTVYYSEYAGYEIDVEGEAVLFLRDSDLLAVAVP